MVGQTLADADVQPHSGVDVGFADLYVVVIVLVLAMIGLGTVLVGLWKIFKYAAFPVKLEPELIENSDDEDAPTPTASSMGFIGVTEVNTIPLGRGRGRVRLMEKKLHKTRQCSALDKATVCHFKIMGKCQTCFKDD